MTPPATTTGMPTHKDLPDSDGAIVENFQESPQSTLLAACLRPRLRELPMTAPRVWAASRAADGEAR